jgi:hypothetical protein
MASSGMTTQTSIPEAQARTDAIDRANRQRDRIRG